MEKTAETRGLPSHHTLLVSLICGHILLACGRAHSYFDVALVLSGFAQDCLPTDVRTVASFALFQNISSQSHQHCGLQICYYEASEL